MPPHEVTSEGVRTPLSDKVREFLKSTGMSKNQFVRGCVDPQHPERSIYIQWLDSLVDGRVPMPELWRLRALAAGLGVDLGEVKRMAAIQWLDYDVEQVPSGDDVIMIPVKRSVSEATRRRIRKIADSLIEEDYET